MFSPPSVRLLLVPFASVWSLLSTFRKTCRVFCENTSLHGLKYVVGTGFYENSGHQRLAQVAWAIISLLGIVFTMVMMKLSWVRFGSTPTITTIETTTYPIWNIPFPAVTICNINKIDRSRTKNLTRQLESLGLTHHQAVNLLVAMSSLVNFDVVNVSYTEYEKLLGKLGYNPQKMLLDLNQPCPSLIRYCYWLGQEVPCDKYFHVTKTHVGFCCSFNVVPAMLVGNKATQLSTRGSTDIRLSGAGKHVGLSVTVDIEPQNYLAPTKSFYGAEVFVHSPNDFPADSDFEDTLQPGWDVDFCVSPMPIDSSESLRRVPLKKRQCFMEGEGTVQSGSPFSSNLCMSECRLRTIVKLCNCVPFFYADFNISETEGVNLCTLADVNCLRHFRKDFYSLKPPRGLSGEHLRYDLGMDCDCMPSCSFLNYQVQSISSRRKAGPFAASSYFGGRNVSSFATLHVHFKDLYCVKYRRDAFMTWDVLLAAFGGIFGLCMGGSVLSVVELLYYFFVKPVTFYKQDQKRREARLNVVSSGKQVVKGRTRFGHGFQPGRYPVGYFDRKKVILRERMSAGSKKKQLGISSFGSYGKDRQINEPDTIFLY